MSHISNSRCKKEDIIEISAVRLDIPTVIVATTEQGHGIIRVVDGFPPKGAEGCEDSSKRLEFLRKIGYKLQVHCMPCHCI